MNKQEFLTQLEEQLRGAVSNQEVIDSVHFYQNYIEEEIRAGRSEEEVLDDLGSAYSIAKSIIDAKGINNSSSTVYEAESPDYEENHSSSKVYRADGWKGTLIIAGIILLLICILIFAFKIFIALVPILIPVAVILYVIRWATGRK